MDPLLTVKDIAAILKVHPNTVYEGARKGDIPSVRTSSSRIRFNERDIKEWIDERSRKALRQVEHLPEFHLDLEDYDRIFLKGGKSAVKERTRRRWNYGFGSIILRKTTEGRDRWSIDYRDRGKRIREVVKDAQTRGEALVALQRRVAESFRRIQSIRGDEAKQDSRLWIMKSRFESLLPSQSSPLLFFEIQITLKVRAYVLLASDVSVTIPSPSALAIIYQVRTAVPCGIMTLVEPELLAPAASDGRSRLPSKMSDASRTVLVDKKNCVRKGPAASPPWFLVVSVMAMLCPALADAGANNAVMSRSGPIWIDLA